jgi:hypothetical protein
VGEVEHLDKLAERINAEHRACRMAALDALEHALAAGDLLLYAKAEHKHGTWLAWLEANFEGSARTAQVYMRLSRDRIVLEGAKAQSAAHLSIAGALEALVEPPKGLPPIPDHTLPVDYPEVLDEPDAEAEARISDAEYVLSTVAKLLRSAQAPELALWPEEAAEALARMKRKDRAALVVDLRNGIAWQERVLEEAVQGQ